MASALDTALDNTLAILRAAIQKVETATGGELQRATPPQLAPVNVALIAARAAMRAKLDVLEAQIVETSIGGVVAGIAVTRMIENLKAQTAIIREDDALRAASNYLARIAANVRVIS